MAESHQPTFADIFDDERLGSEAINSSPHLIDLSGAFDDDAPAGGAIVDSGVRRARFDGDSSELPDEVCWALQELVAAPHITDKAKKHWPVVLQYEDVLRSRLAELGLVLEINRELRYAFTRQGDDPSPHSRTLLRARTLSLAASALALYLYNQYVIAPDDAVVERDDMIDHMLAYKRADDTDDAGYQKKMFTAVRALEETSIIKPIKGTSRYIIYPVITSILTAERVEALHARYTAIAAGTVDASEGEDAPRETDLANEGDRDA